MQIHQLSPVEREKILVLSALWATFAGAFLLVVIAGF